MKVLVKQFSSFMWEGSRPAIEENMLGDKNSLGDRVQVVEGGFTVVSIIVEYMRLVFGLGFYLKSSRFSSPSCSFVML